MKKPLNIIITLCLFFNSAKNQDESLKNYERVYQCNRPSDGSIHFLIIKAVNGKHFGTYLGSEIVMNVKSNFISYDTVYYCTEFSDAHHFDNGKLQFAVKPTKFYTEPFVIDSLGNLVKRPRITTNNISIDLTIGYSFFGEYHDNVIELRRVSPLYFSRSDHFYFTALR